MNRVLKYIEEYDDSLTVGELKKAIEKEDTLTQQKEDAEINSIKVEFENTYLKGIGDSRFYGRRLEIYELKTFVRAERTTDWDFVYSFEGDKISFSAKDINYIKFEGNKTYDMLSAEKLRGMTKISAGEYEKYRNEYLRIQSDLENLIK